MSAFRLLFRFLMFATLPLIFLTKPLYAATPAVTSTALVVSPSSVISGGVVTLTATVTSGGKAVSPGQVLFCDAVVKPCSQVTAIGYAQVVANGTATIRTMVPARMQSIIALFTGTATSAMSVSSPQAVNVSAEQSPTSTSLSAVPGDFNQTPFVTATVVGGASPPSGDLSFVDTQHGNAVVASPPLLSSPNNLTLAQRQYSSLCNCTPTGIVSADFNRDGYPDIAFVGPDNTTGDDIVTILTGHPNGTLSLTSSAVVQHGGYSSIAAGDLNTDGIPDLAVLTGENTTCILIGKGNGSFTQAPCVSTQMYASGIALGDVTNDGNIDLLIGAEYGIAIYPGNGDGTFQTALPIDGNFSGEEILLTDLNGDGILDAVTSGLETLAFLGKGDGTFTNTFLYEFVENTPVATPAVADFNGDGILDLAFLSDKAVFVATGLGNGTFTGTGSSISTFSPPVALFAGDFNNDGIADIYLIHCAAPPTNPGEDYFCESGQSFSSDLYLNDGKENFTSVPGPALGTQPPPAVLASFDNRGLPQVAYVMKTGAPSVASFLPYSTTTAPRLTVPYDTYLAAVFPGDATHLGSSAQVPFEGSPFSFSNGFSAVPSGLFLNGGVGVSGSSLRLTDGGLNERRGAFSSRRVGISSFYTSFDFHLSGAGGAPPTADGFTFVLQGNGPDALGAAGAGLGYGPSSSTFSGPAIDHSIAIKFDLHNNAGEGASSTGFYLNGAIPTVPAQNLLSDFIDLHSGDVFHAIVTYDGSSLELQVSDPTTGAFYRNDTAVNLTQLLGGETAYVGFTASTGSGSAVQDILNWTFTAPSTTQGQIVDIDDVFYNASRLILNGGSRVSQGALLISAVSPSTASSAYFVQKVPTNRFATDFDFNVGSGNGQGFTFVIQSQGSDATGSPGGGLGYGPALPTASTTRITNSVGVKFDLQNNDGKGGNSTGVYLDGASPTLPAVDLLSNGINLHSGHTFHTRLTYDGTNLTEVITDLTQYAEFTKSFPVDIPAAVGNASAYVGFSSATGTASADPIKILNWSLTSS